MVACLPGDQLCACCWLHWHIGDVPFLKCHGRWHTLPSTSAYYVGERLPLSVSTGTGLVPRVPWSTEQLAAFTGRSESQVVGEHLERAGTQGRGVTSPHHWTLIGLAVNLWACSLIQDR